MVRSELPSLAVETPGFHFFVAHELDSTIADTHERQCGPSVQTLNAFGSIYGGETIYDGVSHNSTKRKLHTHAIGSGTL